MQTGSIVIVLYFTQPNDKQSILCIIKEEGEEQRKKTRRRYNSISYFNVKERRRE